jgi:hypothetical protein
MKKQSRLSYLKWGSSYERATRVWLKRHQPSSVLMLFRLREKHIAICNFIAVGPV